ncbi:ribosomal large subunit pseudouridine synthase D [Andreesenia angusta]|uniref:Pseudouridine synthase n=1 Tax=Andreesenia angusta TaxID=39480 RepID=A0A1S1V6U3_9FIRM|nr:RluA family pseudouridine synthase [Andreesenia angusta]OHW62130.1 ribosomal large subunit pseudouridine synthase D [Andreesenia angusta]
MKQNILVESESVVSFEVKADSDNLEQFLKREYDVSSRLIKKMVRERSIFLNGEKVRRNVSVKKGDTVSLLMDDEDDNNLPEPEIELDIIYEDIDLVVLNKRPFTVVHTTQGHPIGTIANGLAYYFLENKIKKKIRFINRLDRDTSGVLLVGKNSFAHQQISKQFKDNTVEKTYLTVVDGVVGEDKATIDLPIERESEDSIMRIVREDGKRAVTHYEVVERYKDATLLKVRLETGRTHQIRVHLKHIGHPIIGDSLYFKESPDIDRQALHSYAMKLRLPRDKSEIELRAELPYDILNLIEKLKKA